MKLGNCIKAIVKTHLILKILLILLILLILVFILLVLILDGFFRSMSEMKDYNFLNPRKIAIQHLNQFFTVGPKLKSVYVPDVLEIIFVRGASVTLKKTSTISSSNLGQRTFSYKIPCTN